MINHGDYVVYVDESGDHGLKSIDPQFPVFALSFCVVSKSDYISEIVPEFQKFKFRYWGHDMVVLHEHEIRKEKNDFGFLMANRDLRLRFLEDLSRIVEASPFKIISSVIRKDRLKQKYPDPFNPYEIAMRFCLERLLDFLVSRNQKGKTIHIIFECRGPEEDRELELEFRRICDDNVQWGWKKKDFTKINLVPRFAKKSVNSTGLQLADLTARPIALKILRPSQPNRAYDIIQSKQFSSKAFP